MLSTSASTSNRLLKKAAHCVLSRPSPCDVPQGYASVAALPAALLSAFLSSLLKLMQFPLSFPQSLAGSLLLWKRPLKGSDEPQSTGIINSP